MKFTHLLLLFILSFSLAACGSVDTLPDAAMPVAAEAQPAQALPAANDCDAQSILVPSEIIDKAKQKPRVGGGEAAEEIFALAIKTQASNEILGAYLDLSDHCQAGIKKIDVGKENQS